MATLYLLDTNTLSYIATGRSPAARVRLAGLGRHETACVSTVSEGEIRFGLAKRPGAHPARNAIENLLGRVQLLAWGSEEAAAYGRLRANLESLGKPLGNLDMLIAAHALALRATLVTNDKAFTRVAQLPLENWATDL